MSNKKKMEVLYFVAIHKKVWISAYCAGYRKRFRVSFPINCAWLSSAIEGRTSD